MLDVLATWNREAGERPCRVVALDNFRTGLPERVRHLADDAHIEFAAHDVSCPLASLPSVDWIVHAASIASPTFYRRFPLETIKRVRDADYEREVVPADFTRPGGTLYLPYRSVLLPGTLYIHDLVLIGDDLFVTPTGHNSLARVLPSGGWQRVWWPGCLDGLGRASFDQNYLQLNSIACAGSPDRSYYTAFEDETFGPKPWKAGYGPPREGRRLRGLDPAPDLPRAHLSPLREAARRHTLALQQRLR